MKQCIKLCLPIFTLLISLLAGTQTAEAHRSPANCFGVAPRLGLMIFHENGSFANAVTNGEKLIYVFSSDNALQLPTPIGNVPSCDITCAHINFQCPDVNGNPGPTALVATDINLPFGTPDFNLASVTCVVSVASTPIVARATAQIGGVVHNISIVGCSPDATCVTNQCDPNSVLTEISAAVYVLTPAVKISAWTTNIINLGSALSFTVYGMITNSGDETLLNLSVVDDVPSGSIVVTNISAVPKGAVVPFSASVTNNSTSCPAFLNKVKVTATSLATIVQVTDKAESMVNLISPASLRLPTFDTDGSTHLVADCTPGWSYVLQSSSNLLNWSAMDTNIALSTPITLKDPSGLTTGFRFYRAVAVCQ